MRNHLLEVVTHHQSIALQMAQRARQHPLRDTVHPSADFRVAKLAVHAERMDDTKRPAVAGMGQDLTANPVVIVPEAIANRLRISEDVLLA